MERLRVKSGQFDYEAVIGRGAWRELEAFAAGNYSSVFVLTEAPLWRRWGKAFLKESGLARPLDSAKLKTLFIPRGEKSKSLATVERVAANLLASGADRKSLLVIFGGGVAGDVGGFVASTYMRGIDCVQAPTTVVAQVDSSVGGKTGVNVGRMKNLVGTFYPPRLVLSDPVVLGSLTARAFRSGLYEVAKHGILAGEPLFGRLEAKLSALKPRDLATLEPLLAEAARVKVDVVTRDEREAELRQVLNLGHTFGHALEEATGYRRLMHGEAVGWGLLGVVRLAERLGALGGEDAKRMTALVRSLGPLPSIARVDAARIVKLLPQDKKSVGGKIHWVIPEAIGRVKIMTDVPPSEARAAFDEIRFG